MDGIKKHIICRHSDTPTLTALQQLAAFISTLGFLYIQYLQSSTLLSIQYLQFYTPGTFSELRVTHKHIFWINRKYTARCPAEHKYWLQWCCSAAAELLQSCCRLQLSHKHSANPRRQIFSCYEMSSRIFTWYLTIFSVLHQNTRDGGCLRYLLSICCQS